MEYIKNFTREAGVNKWKWGKWVAIFPKNWYCPTTFNYVTQISIRKFILHIWKTVYLHLILFRLASFPPLLCISTKNKTKLKKTLNLNHRLNKVEHKFANIQAAFDFLWTLLLRINLDRGQTKLSMERGVILIWRFVVKVRNNLKNFSSS